VWLCLSLPHMRALISSSLSLYLSLTHTHTHTHTCTEWVHSQWIWPASGVPPNGNPKTQEGILKHAEEFNAYDLTVRVLYAWVYVCVTETCACMREKMCVCMYKGDRERERDFVGVTVCKHAELNAYVSLCAYV
jgi:hypothetical protein